MKLSNNEIAPKKESTLARPFLKWVGGKTQLLEQIRPYYRINSERNRYIEPFVGGGAVLIDILNRFCIDEVFINDSNPELINAYKCIRDEVEELISLLKAMQVKNDMVDIAGRKTFYLENRQRFNELITKGNSDLSVEKAALMIFLNKTCFNGLYRVNSKGHFNVPMGSYVRPIICDDDNLRTLSVLLKPVQMSVGDYQTCIKWVNGSSFVYIDPPYRPLTSSANFTSYTKSDFNDGHQKELALFAEKLVEKGAQVLLSNADPKNIDEDDNFFDELYSKFRITRVYASRAINSKADGRGKVAELLISSV